IIHTHIHICLFLSLCLCFSLSVSLTLTLSLTHTNTHTHTHTMLSHFTAILLCIQTSLFLIAPPITCPCFLNFSQPPCSSFIPCDGAVWRGEERRREEKRREEK